MDPSEKLSSIRKRMQEAATRARRDPAAVRLVAVAKTRTPEEIRGVLHAGVEDIGENRVQEAEAKRPVLANENVTWHLVGHLQGNKAARAVALFDLIHSADSVELARRLSRLAGEAGKTQRLLVQVDLAGEKAKSGLPEKELLPALESLRTEPHLHIEGLMVLPPLFEDPEKARPFFARLRELEEAAAGRGLLSGRTLSMGMSQDFEVAIEEGATIVRIGTALFGERPSKTEDWS